MPSAGIGGTPSGATAAGAPYLRNYAPHRAGLAPLTRASPAQDAPSGPRPTWDGHTRRTPCDRYPHHGSLGARDGEADRADRLIVRMSGFI
jgi:hypothetical protein